MIEKRNKGSDFIPSETTNEDDVIVEEKDPKWHNLVSHLGIRKPNRRICESLYQASNPNQQLVEVGTEMDVGYPP